MLSGLWAALVILTALASSDPGQTYLARLLILPIIGLWCLGFASAWMARVLRPREPELTAAVGPATHIPSLRQQQPAWWWAAALVYAAAILGAFVLQSGPQGNDLLHQSARIVGSTLVIAALAGLAYTRIPHTPEARAKLLLAAACICGAFVLWQALDDTQRLRPEPAPLTAQMSQSAPSRDGGPADVAKSGAKTRSQVPARPAAGKSTAQASWEAPLSEAIARNNSDQLALASKWESDVEKLQFESMLTPSTLTSAEGRKQNREKLARFEALLAGYLSQLETLQRDYRSNVLAIDIPDPQREGFVREFERAFAASVAETRALNADFQRVELAISKTILGITDLMEREDDAVTVGPDGRTLLFERDQAADQYNELLQALAKITEEEGVVMSKTGEAYRRRTESLDTVATGLR
jgi:hypothetical protein